MDAQTKVTCTCSFTTAAIELNEEKTLTKMKFKYIPVYKNQIQKCRNYNVFQHKIVKYFMIDF